MRKAILVGLLIGLVLQPGLARAKTHAGLTYSTTAVKTGVWSSKFTKCKAYAEKHGRPLIVLWANDGCHNCEAVCRSLGSSSSFKSWMSSSGAVFVFGVGTKGENAQIKEFARYSTHVSFPLMAVYLKQKGASSRSVYKAFTGAGGNASSILSTIKGLLKPYARIKLKAGTGGSVTQVGYRTIGKTTTLVAKPSSRYKFKGWYNSSGSRVSKSAKYRLKVKKAATFTAKFTKK